MQHMKFQPYNWKSNIGYKLQLTTTRCQNAVTKNVSLFSMTERIKDVKSQMTG